ncbi:MAG: hypothetical protein JXA64_12020 [Candidatus Fermentibacteraceae bacterium]|nr:hypothetical protein [Candidatus Fermentibacteraceae bacterium]MBN2609825.1 hypothetical protein [Candidatus Fermentibacteraceae bacterium]
MKCLQLSGDVDLVRRFITGMTEHLEGRSVLVVGTDPAGRIIITSPGRMSVHDVLDSMPPDLVLVTGTQELAAPVVRCDREPREEREPLLLAVYSGDDASTDFQDILSRVFGLLPQKTKEDCGRCGTDCRGLAAAILDGSRKPGDCYYAPGNVEILQDGRRMELGDFPSRAVEGTLKGLLSSLKGYRAGSSVTVRLREGS